MSYLRIYNESDASTVCFESADFNEIHLKLGELGVRFERWNAGEVASTADAASLLATFNQDIERLKEETGCTTADVISLTPEHPQKTEFRDKFLAEHIHSEDEIRFFVRGSGLFYLHLNQRVYIIRCEKNDLISVPDAAAHWFDMGPEPDFTCIRLFTNTEGWVAQYTGNVIADNFPKWETLESIS